MRTSGIPLSLKLGFTAWMMFWVPVVLTNQGPQNFFWLCNLAQFITLYAIWTENRLLIASQVGVVTVVGIGWTLDVAAGVALGDSPTGLTAYMFSDRLPLIARLSSLYHIFLPILLIVLVWRLGYDRRGPWLQCVIGGGAIIGGWLFTEPERNVNWMFYAFGSEQTWMPEPLWALVLMVAYPVLFYFPGHWLMLRLMSHRSGQRAGEGGA